MPEKNKIKDLRGLTPAGGAIERKALFAAMANRPRQASSPLLIAWAAAPRSQKEQLLRHVFGALAGEIVMAAMMRVDKARVVADPARSTRISASKYQTHPVDEFLATCIQQQAGAMISADHLHRLFCAFTTARQLPPLSRVFFRASCRPAASSGGGRASFFGWACSPRFRRRNSDDRGATHKRLAPVKSGALSTLPTLPFLGGLAIS